MPIVIICGLQYGDEGKGKFVDMLSVGAKYCCRVNGGPNAGHTVVYNGQTHKFKQLPSGVLTDDCQLIIGPGCVIDAGKLMEEIDMDQYKVATRLHISTQAHLIFDVYKEIDMAIDEARTEPIKTTGSGIGPCYAAKALRVGLRVEDVVNSEKFGAKYDFMINNFARRLLAADNNSEHGITRYIDKVDGFTEYLKAREITQFAKNTQTVLRNFKPNEHTMIIEVAQGSLLDIDHGDYPNVTSSCTNFSAALSGMGIPYKFVAEVIGVVKLFTTRSGAGFFPTELTTGAAYDILKQGEIGVNTQRQRRIGWLDLPAIRHALFVNNVSTVALSKFDVIGQLDLIKIGAKYYRKNDPDQIPISWIEAVELGQDKIEVEYITLDGWPKDVDQVKQAKCFDDLPQKAKNFLQTMQMAIPQPIVFVGNGPSREDVLYLMSPMDESEEEPSDQTVLNKQEETNNN